MEPLGATIRSDPSPSGVANSRSATLSVRMLQLVRIMHTDEAIIEAHYTYFP